MSVSFTTDTCRKAIWSGAMADEQLAEIKKIYFDTTRKTIDSDFDRAVDLIKSMPEDERHRATVYMEGLAQMRKEFTRGGRRPGDSADGDDLETI